MPVYQSPGKVLDLVKDRHRAVQDAARWLEPGPASAPSLPLSVAVVFHDVAAWLLGHITMDDPQLTRCLDTLTQAKDYAVRAALLQEAASGDQ